MSRKQIILYSLSILARFLLPFVVFVTVLHVCSKPINAAWEEKRIRIGVLETGISADPQYNKGLCIDGHRDFTGTNLYDSEGHGPNVYSIITSRMDVEHYCITMIKVFERSINQPKVIVNAGIAYAMMLKVRYLNMSFGGDGQNAEEVKLINKLILSGVKITVASGNDGKNLSDKCNYFPACTPLKHPNFKVVGALKDGLRWRTSNYGGPVNTWENGVHIYGGGHIMSGTSQAAAVAMSKWIESDDVREFHGGVNK